MSEASSSKTKIFKCQQHAVNVSEKLQTFYKQKEFFDVTLIAAIDNVKVGAHRLVLSASSDYFLAMSRNDCKAEQFKVANTNGDTLQSILDFMYTSSIELRKETVEKILRCAVFFQMDTLRAACCDFMGDQLDAYNCLGTAFLAESHGYTELYKKCLKFAANDFEKVCTAHEFLQLSADQLNKFLSCGDIRIESQEKLFNSLLAWYHHDEANRGNLISSILSQHIRYELLEPQFIIENSDGVRQAFECSELIHSWIRWHLSPECRGRKSKKFMLTYNSDNKLIIQTYLPELNKWSYEEWPQPPVERSLYGKLVINGKLIIAGGSFEGAITNQVECFDLQTKEWSLLPPMETKRVWPFMAEINGNLYVFGGYEALEAHEDPKSLTGLRSMEKYDFTTRKWQQLAPTPATVEFGKAAVLDGMLYVSNSNEYHLECYNSNTNEWTQTAVKNEKSHSFGLAAINGHVYAIGGKIKYKRKVKTVERYNPSNNTWTVIKPLEVARADICCAAWNGRILACGGIDPSGNLLNTVEEYDTQTNEWRSLTPFLLELPEYHLTKSFIYTISVVLSLA